MLFFLAGFQQVEFNVSGLSWLLIALYFARRRLLVVTWLGGDLLPGKRSGPVSLIEWSIVCWSRHQDLCRTSLTLTTARDRLCPTSNDVGAVGNLAWISPGISWIPPESPESLGLGNIQVSPTSNDVGAGGNLAAPRTSTDLSSLVNPSTPEFELRWLQRKTWPQQDTLFCHQGLSTRKNPANFLKSRWKVKR